MKNKEIFAALIQMPVGKEFEVNLSNAGKFVEDAASKKEKTEVICLPEYFFAYSFRGRKPEEVYKEMNEKTTELLENLSETYGTIIGGTVIEKEEGKFFNSCVVYKEGKLIGKQRKVHLTKGEIEWGLSKSSTFEVMKSKIGNIGVLVCADVLYPEACRVLGLKKADIVLNPVISRFIEHDKTKKVRKCIFISRAYDNGCFILKTGGVGFSPFGSKIVGRSLIASPWGVIAYAEDEKRAGVITASLDMELLKKVREETFYINIRERVKEAYKPLVE